MIEIRSPSRADLPWRLRLKQAYRERQRRIHEAPTEQDDRLTRVWRWWSMPSDQSRMEIFPRRAARVLTRRPPVTVDLGTSWMVAALRKDARLLKKLDREVQLGRQPAKLSMLRWERGPMGVKILDENGGPVTFQTIANDLRAMADGLDFLARIDRGDRDRHD